MRITVTFLCISTLNILILISAKIGSNFLAILLNSATFSYFPSSLNHLTGLPYKQLSKFISIASILYLMNVYFQMLYQGLLYLGYNTCEFKSAQCWEKENSLIIQPSYTTIS